MQQTTSVEWKSDIANKCKGIKTEEAYLRYFHDSRWTRLTVETALINRFHFLPDFEVIPRRSPDFRNL